MQAPGRGSSSQTKDTQITSIKHEGQREGNWTLSGFNKEAHILSNILTEIWKKYLLAGPFWRRDAARIWTETGDKKDKGKKKERHNQGGGWGGVTPRLHSASSNNHKLIVKLIVPPTGESWDRGRLPNKDKAIEKP